MCQQGHKRTEKTTGMPREEGVLYKIGVTKKVRNQFSQLKGTQTPQTVTT